MNLQTYINNDTYTHYILYVSKLQQLNTVVKKVERLS